MSESPSIQELDFERPLASLERQIHQLEAGARDAQGCISGDMQTEIDMLRDSHARLIDKTYVNLSAVNTVKVARHPARPQTIDYINAFVNDFTELHGDRMYGDDAAIICGFGRIGGRKIMLVGHHKGKDTEEKIKANFGCAHPEGYRKAMRCMELADKFGVPVVTLIDTPGAYPGIGAEERGQAEAIAWNLREMANLKVPVISVVIGEGGSGGALGIGVSDRLAMLQYAWYSVISPEGCAAILWKVANTETNALAAEALKLTAKANLELGTVDAIVHEPKGGAHRDPEQAAELLESWILETLEELESISQEERLETRYQRLRQIGVTAN